jgi:cytochrome c oxidase assembly protein subunit 15
MIVQTAQNFQPNPQRSLALWLFGCAGLVFLMVIIGAITRLTESGLSITEWRPLIGAIPPLSAQDWQDVFALYQQTPEFQKKNFWMDIDDFKLIFFWEWLHRFMGRIIGLAYGLPLLWFWVKGLIPRGYKLKLFGLLLLGGAQGFMGWFMVQSGLVDIPAVSHYRLAAHLGLAFVIFCLLIWLGLSIAGSKRAPSPALFWHSVAVLGLVVITILWGAFTAGLDAGLLYNEYPLMGGGIAPPDLLFQQPAWINFFENPSAVQFTHRWLAALSVLGLLSLWLHGWRAGKAFAALHGLGTMAIIQFSLGVATLLSGVNIIIAAAHQAGALIVLLLLVMVLHRTRRI